MKNNQFEMYFLSDEDIHRDFQKIGRHLIVADSFVLNVKDVILFKNNNIQAQIVDLRLMLFNIKPVLETEQGYRYLIDFDASIGAITSCRSFLCERLSCIGTPS